MFMEMWAYDLTRRFPVVRTSIEIWFCWWVIALALLLGIPERKRERREERERTAGDSQLLSTGRESSIFLSDLEKEKRYNWTTNGPELHLDMQRK